MPTGFAPLLGSSRSPSVPSLRAARPCSPACAAPWARLRRPHHTVTAPSSTSCSPGPGCRLPCPRAAAAAAAAASAAAPAAPAAAAVAMQLAPAAAVGVVAVVAVAVVVLVRLPRGQPLPPLPRLLHRSLPPTRMTRMQQLLPLPSPPLRRLGGVRRNVPSATPATGPRTMPRLTAGCGLASASSASPTALVLLATPTPSANAPYILGPRSRYPGSSATATDSSGRSGVIGATPRTPSPPLLAPTPTAFPAASPSPLPPLFAPSACLTPPPPRLRTGPPLRSLRWRRSTLSCSLTLLKASRPIADRRSNSISTRVRTPCRVRAR